MSLHPLQSELCRWHQHLFNEGLVTWSQGNISVRDGNHMFIKASGVRYDYLDSRHMVRVGLTLGSYKDDSYLPSTDTDTHLYIYNHTDVGAIVHTHSTFATAFSAAGLNIPCCLTGQADMFGGDIPCTPYAEIGGDEIGKTVVATLWGESPGVALIQNHGLFAVGKTMEEAVKRAVMAEDCAKTTYYATALEPIRLTDKQIADNYERYNTSYGQK
jgi:L-ribulose-5-phosphate 4-epimerase